ncbi:zinc finger CCCH-type with G patch domain-containing protein [Engraulis encrasicolus]|uniref:zinc finger CCCH-type with G patch domain-containing protein n=1 Tax=Engraulis encrasicolus TaxID=184585 RepID=UPI002FD6DEAE
MDEGALLASIETYNAQLQQVELALGAGLDGEQEADLLQLKGDLQQLVELTESSLLSLRKSQLLASLEGAPTESQQGHTAQAQLDDEFASFYSELVGDEEEEEEEEEGEDYLSGSKVRAPYYTSWGTLEYHNAMVVGVEPVVKGEGSEEQEEERVRVLYLYPTHRSMKPCPYFLEDKCRFLDKCKFSHGEVVCVSELKEFVGADLSDLKEDSSCLARHEDGVWYPAKITELKDGVYKVKYDSLLLKEAVLEADGVIPPMRTDDPVSSDSDDDADMAFAKVLDSPDGGWSEVNQAEFGGWEIHTRGIGSRLLMKMGYEQGKGLGKSLEGRVEPVQAMVIPRGDLASLEGCGELARSLAMKPRPPKDKDSAPLPKKKLKRKSGGGGGEGKPNVFDFLNAKLGAAQSRPQARPSAAPRDAYRGGKSDTRAMNVQLFKATEGIAQTEKEIQQIRHSLSRKAGRDAAVIGRLEEKLAAAQKRLTQLKAQEQQLQSQRKRADTHKNMTEF